MNLIKEGICVAFRHRDDELSLTEVELSRICDKLAPKVRDTLNQLVDDVQQLADEHFPGKLTVWRS